MFTRRPVREAARRRSGVSLVAVQACLLFHYSLTLDRLLNHVLKLNILSVTALTGSDLRRLINQHFTEGTLNANTGPPRPCSCLHIQTTQRW